MGFFHRLDKPNVLPITRMVWLSNLLFSSLFGPYVVKRKSDDQVVLKIIWIQEKVENEKQTRTFYDNFVGIGKELFTRESLHLY